LSYRQGSQYFFMGGSKPIFVYTFVPGPPLWAYGAAARCHPRWQSIEH
jgi:hypothetical protein